VLKYYESSGIIEMSMIGFLDLQKLQQNSPCPHPSIKYLTDGQPLNKVGGVSSNTYLKTLLNGHSKITYIETTYW